MLRTLLPALALVSLCSVAAADDEVRPPKAEDLATYAKTIKGTGALTATIDTSQGTIHCTLLDAESPLAVANFIGLATGQKPWKDPGSGKTVTKKPFYDGLTFHRVIPEFMVQGGDPVGSGRGNAGYQFPNESQVTNWVPGTLAMANAGKDTNGTQFFITEIAPEWLKDGYTIFGRCQEVDVVKQIARVPASKSGKPETAVVIKKVTITKESKKTP